jgi:hypothetical protein
VTFLAPAFLFAGAAVASAIVLLHFLARRRPRPAMLPTARFVPDRPARWPSRAPRPTDWWLLALRVLAIVSIATAFAGPRREPDRAVTRRIVLVDRSRAVGDERAMRDSVLAVVHEGDVLMPFDTAVRTISAGTRDSSAVLTRSESPASLSTALIVAERVTATLRNRADSVELIIASPFALESWDEATPVLRRRWAGRLRLITLPLASGDSTALRIDVRTPLSDPVAAAAAPFTGRGDVLARVVRDNPSAEDSGWARASGNVVVHWPRGEAADSLTPQAIVTSDGVLAAPLVRRSLDPNGVRIVARFADGSAAIVERVHGRGCIRDVAFDFPIRGDVALRESARRLVAVVAAPCEGRRSQRTLSAAQLSSLRGTGGLLATSTVPRMARARSAATPWLLIVGALLLLMELGVRRRTSPT